MRPRRDGVRATPVQCRRRNDSHGEGGVLRMRTVAQRHMSVVATCTVALWVVYLSIMCLVGTPVLAQETYCLDAGSCSDDLATTTMMDEATCSNTTLCTCVNNAVVNIEGPSCQCDTGFYKDGTACLGCAGACSTDEYQTQECTPTTNRECATCRTTCSAGQYLTECMATSNAQCVNCLTCTSEQYETTPCTLNSNRECAACTNCTSGQFEAMPCTTTTDRTCSGCTECTGDQYASTPCATDADTVCSDCTACNEGEEYMTEPCTPTTNRKCEACDACAAGEYVAANCTATENTQCANCTVCDSMQYESAPCTTFSDRQCLPCNSCDPTTHYEAQACSASQDTVCAACTTCDDPEQYAQVACSATADVVCNNCTVCSGTEFETSPCTAEADRQCEGCTMCTANQYQTRDCGATEDRICAPCSDCGMEEFVFTGCGATTDTVCANCTVCGQEQYQTRPCTESQDRQCADCTLCEEGFYASRECMATLDRNCTACHTCEDDEFETVPCTQSSNRECQGCRTCDPTEYIAQPCNTTANTVCDACLVCEQGTYWSGGCDGVNQRTCSPCTVCDSDTEYQTAECTPYVDTQCTNLTLCDFDNEFMSRAPTATTDRECTDLTVCDTMTQYESTPKTPTSDRICSPITACTTGFFETAAPTATTDRVCAMCPNGTVDDNGDGLGSCVQCSPGVYVPAGSEGPCSNFECSPGSADLDMDPATECEMCDGVSEYQDEAGQTECKPVSDCPAGEEENTPPAPNVDRTCRFCVLGKTFKDSTGQAKCVNTTTCPPGEEETTAATRSSDRICTMCPDGKVKEQPGQDTSCVPYAICQRGEQETVMPTASTDRVCEDCPPHFFKSTIGQDPCAEVTVCAQAQYEVRPPTTSQDRVCEPYTDCGGSEWEAVAPTETSDRVCEDCSECPAGRREIQPCTTTSDRVCEDCSACQEGVEFIAQECGAEDTVCQTCRDCSATQYETAACQLRQNRECTDLTRCTGNQFEETAPTATTDRVCVALTTCTSLEYENTPATATSDRTCAALTPCRAGEYEAQAPTATTDRQCSQCPAGTTDHDSSGATACQSCSAGSYLPAGSAGSCDAFACLAGTVDDDSMPSTECEDCQPGASYQPQSGQTACIPVTVCGPGQTESVSPTAVRDRACTQCGAGKFKDTEGSDPCQDWSTCTQNEFVSKQPTRSSDRQCTEYTPCRATEYETLAPTATTDRQCTAATVCGDRQYETKAPTATTDRTCGMLTVCTNDEFEAEAPTPTTDRICMDVQSCDDGFFIQEEATATSDRVCTPWTTCENDEYQSRAPSLFRNRVCTKISACAGDTYETAAPTATSDRVCGACDVCSGDTFEARPCTPSTNRRCEACALCAQGVTYEVQACTPSTDRVCASCSTCQDGFFISTACTTTSDTQCSVCSQCERGTYLTQPCSEAADTQCSTCSSCDDGVTFETGGCTSMVDTVCTACSACGNTQFISLPCTTERDTGCTDCTVCPKGKYTDAACTPTSDTMCDDCEAGKFADVAGVTACTECTSCQAGTFIQTPCSAASDTVCEECEVGKYQDRTDRTGCRRCSVCPAGKRETGACTLSSDTVCEDCGDGTYQDQQGRATCNTCTRCSSDEYEAQPCTATSDTVCRSCTTGCDPGERVTSLCSDTSNLACIVCGLGTFQDADDHLDTSCLDCETCREGEVVTRACTRLYDRVCQSCAPGKFSDVTNAQVCSECGHGTYQNLPGQSSCTPCAAGTASKQTAATSEDVCEPCDQGEFQDLEGQAGCKQCPAGTANDLTGSKSLDSCIECSPGSFQDQQGQATCMSCSAGKYQNEDGRVECKRCPKGTFSTLVGATTIDACQECRAGFYQSSTGQTSCVPCAEGTYSTETGAKKGDKCLECSRGEYQDQTGSQTCKQCPRGTFGLTRAATSIDACTQCPAGKHQPSAGQVGCIDCPIGTYTDKRGQSSCAVCNASQFQDQKGQETCKPCVDCLDGYTDLGGCNRTHDRICKDVTAPVITLTDRRTGNTIEDVQVVEAADPRGYSPLKADAYDEAEGRQIIPVREGEGNIDIDTPGEFTVVFTATDRSGNVARREVTVQVVDATKPTITFDPRVLVVEAATDPDFLQGVSAYDTVDGDLTMFVDTNAGVVVNLQRVGEYEARYFLTRRDSSSNPADEVTRTVRVVDTTPPTIMLLGEEELEHEAGTPYVDAGYTATDTLDGVLTNTDQVTIAPEVNVFAQDGDVFIITYTATDQEGNVASVQRIVTIVDTQAPVISVEGDVEVFAEAALPYDDAGATAEDVRDGPITPLVDNPVNTFPAAVPREFTVRYTATDAAGNSALATRKVTVRDTTPPSISLRGGNPIYIEAGIARTVPGVQVEDLYTSVTDIAVESDVGDVVNINPPSTPAEFEVTHTATDGSGNQAQITRTVIVRDTLPPQVVLAGSETLVWEGGVTWRDPGLRSATDLFDGNLLDQAVASVRLRQLGVRQVFTCSFSTANEFASPPQQVQEHSTPTNVRFVDVFAPPDTVFDVTYTVSDRAGNTASTTRAVVLRDTLPPDVYLVGPPTMYLEYLPEERLTDTALAGLLYPRQGAEAQDRLDGDISSEICVTVARYEFLYWIPGATPAFNESEPWYRLQQRSGISRIVNSEPLGTLFVVEYAAHDGEGNRGSVQRRVLVRDSTPPDITLIGNTTVSIPYGTTAEHAVAGYSALDLHDGDVTGRVRVTGANTINVYQSGRYEVVYHAADSSNNTATATRVVDVEPLVRPPPGFVVELRFEAFVNQIIPDVVQFQIDMTLDVFGGDFVSVLSVRDNPGQTTGDTRVEIGVRHQDTLRWIPAEDVARVVEASRSVGNGDLLGYGVASVKASSSAGSAGGPQTGVIAAVVVCVVIVVAVVAFVVVRRRTHRNPLGPSPVHKPSGWDESNPNPYHGAQNNGRRGKKGKPTSMLDVDHRERASIGMTYENPLFQKRKKAPDNGLYELEKDNRMVKMGDMYTPAPADGNPGNFGFEVFQGGLGTADGADAQEGDYDTPQVRFHDPQDNGMYDKPIVRPEGGSGAAGDDDDDEETYDLPNKAPRRGGAPPPLPAKKGGGADGDMSDVFAGILEATNVDDDEDGGTDLLGHAVTLPGYWGQIKRAEAEQHLEGEPPGSYLLRASQSVGGVVLSCKTPAGHVEHHVMEMNAGGRVTVNAEEIPNCVGLSQAIGILRGTNNFLPYVLTQPLKSPTKGDSEFSLSFVRGTSQRGRSQAPARKQRGSGPPLPERQAMGSTPFGGQTQWLHGSISRKEAESRLQAAGLKDGHFLVRAKDDSYALSMASGGRVTHHLITRGSDGAWKVNKKPLPQPCSTVEEVITLLSHTRLDTVPTLLSGPLPPDTEA